MSALDAQDGDGVTEIPLPPEPRSSQNPLLRHELHVLRQRYFRIRADYLAIEGQGGWPSNDHRLGLVREQMASACGQMAIERPDMLAASTALSVADRQLVWRYADHVVRARARLVNEQLAAQGSAEQTVLRDLAAIGSLAEFPVNYPDRLALETGIQRLDEAHEDAVIAMLLQARRLRVALLLTILSTAALLAVVPLVTPSSPTDGWPPAVIADLRDTWSSWLSALAILAIGCAGGAFSGLIQIRGSATTLLDYRQGMLEFALRPAIGSLLALLTYLFLSWSVLPGISVTSGGSFLIAAFLAGFSERWFLGALQINGARHAAQTRGNAKPLESSPAEPRAVEAHALGDAPPSFAAEDRRSPPLVMTMKEMTKEVTKEALDESAQTVARSGLRAGPTSTEWLEEAERRGEIEPGRAGVDDRLEPPRFRTFMLGEPSRGGFVDETDDESADGEEYPAT